jgi:hypothetical protein
MQALEAQQATHSPLVDRRRYQRVRLNLLGRCMFPDQRECPCQLVEISPGDASFLSPLCGEMGGRVIAYIDSIGRLEGDITELRDGGFLMSINASQKKRDKLADTLTWLANRNVLSLAEDRRHLRRTPKRKDAVMVFADGESFPCRVIDMSLSGAALATPLRPPTGTPSAWVVSAQGWSAILTTGSVSSSCASCRMRQSSRRSSGSTSRTPAPVF